MNVRKLNLPQMEPGYIYILDPATHNLDTYVVTARIAGVTESTIEAAEDIASARGGKTTYAYLEEDGDNHRLICPDIIQAQEPTMRKECHYGEPERSTLQESRAEAYNEEDKLGFKTGDVIEGKSVGRDFIAEYDALVKALARRHITAELELKSAQESRDENGAIILKLRNRVFELEAENQKLKDQAALGVGATNTAQRYASEARHLETALREIKDMIANCESGDHVKALMGLDAARRIATAALKGRTT